MATNLRSGNGLPRAVRTYVRPRPRVRVGNLPARRHDAPTATRLRVFPGSSRAPGERTGISPHVAAEEQGEHLEGARVASITVPRA